MKKVSVIIPVYNTAPFLRECLLSVKNQTLRDLEIVIVDDGSTDGSLEIIQDEAAKDSRIVWTTQPNSGQSVARNKGIDKATGEYIYFMDSDDLLEPDTFLECYNKAAANNLDLVFFDAKLFDDQDKAKKWWFSYNRSSLDENEIFNGVDITDKLIKEDMFFASVCLFFCKRELIEKGMHRFYPGIIHEDELFTPLLFIEAERVGYINRIFFKRRVRTNSTMTHRFSEKNIKGYLTVIDQLKYYSNDRNEKVREIVNALVALIVNALTHQARIINCKERWMIIKYIIKNRYFNLIPLKSKVIVFFPVTITIKSKIIKPFKNFFRPRVNN